MSVADASAEFELTVVGGLGPVLRWALRPGRVVESRTCTTFRSASVADVEAIIALVDSFELRLESVYVVSTGGPGSHG